MAADWLIQRFRIGNDVAEFALAQEARWPSAFYAASFLFLVEMSVMFEHFRSVARVLLGVLRSHG